MKQESNDGYQAGHDDNDKVCHLIDLHLSEGIVDLGGGELDSEGHEGVSERINMRMIAIMVIMLCYVPMVIMVASRSGDSGRWLLRSCSEAGKRSCFVTLTFAAPALHYITCHMTVTPMMTMMMTTSVLLRLHHWWALPDK